MANTRPKISDSVKNQLIASSGGKCANPGCSTWRVHIHHIREWAVYQAHDSEDMIAVCPTCHDACHHGRLRIDDETLYRWKRIKRRPRPSTAHIYVEPGEPVKLIAGSIAFSPANRGMVLFELKNRSEVRLRVLEGSFLQLSARIFRTDGVEALRVTENHVTELGDTRVVFDCRPGRVRVTVPANDEFVPSWMLDQMHAADATCVVDDLVVSTDLEVLAPGVLKLRGCWPDGNVGIVVSEKQLMFFERESSTPTTFAGVDGEPLIRYHDHDNLGQALWGFFEHGFMNPSMRFAKE